MWLLLGASATFGCETGVETVPEMNPIPIVRAAYPSVVAEGAETQIQVVGAGFAPGAEIFWDGSQLPTEVVSPTRLEGSLVGADLTGPRDAALEVANPEPGGGRSAPLSVTVGHPRPVLASISPSSTEVVVTPSLDIQLMGTRFATSGGGAVVYWGGVPLATAVVSSMEVRATVPGSLLRTPGALAVWVKNPGPGGGSSESRTVALSNPTPIIERTGVLGASFGPGYQVLEVHGTGFAIGASTAILGHPVGGTVQTHERITVGVPDSIAFVGESFPIVVFNAPPGGGFSTPFEYRRSDHPPWIFRLTPDRVLAGMDAFTLTIGGKGFSTTAIVTVDGAPRPATVVDHSRIDVSVSAVDVSTPGLVEIRVDHPGGFAVRDLTVME